MFKNLVNLWKIVDKPVNSYGSNVMQFAIEFLGLFSPFYSGHAKDTSNYRSR